MPWDSRGQHYTTTGRGVNSQGNQYSTRRDDHGNHGYRYSNQDGGYYYKNFDDSRYYESGNGRYAHYDRPSGDRYVYDRTTGDRYVSQGAQVAPQRAERETTGQAYQYSGSGNDQNAAQYYSWGHYDYRGGQSWDTSANSRDIHSEVIHSESEPSSDEDEDSGDAGSNHHGQDSSAGSDYEYHASSGYVESREDDDGGYNDDREYEYYDDDQGYGDDGGYDSGGYSSSGYDDYSD